MAAWHAVRYTPEEQAEMARRSKRMFDLMDMPAHIEETVDGFIASREGNSATGKTEREAILNLEMIEHYDAVDPEGIRHKYFAQYAESNGTN